MCTRVGGSKGYETPEKWHVRALNALIDKAFMRILNCCSTRIWFFKHFQEIIRPKVSHLTMLRAKRGFYQISNFTLTSRQPLELCFSLIYMCRLVSVTRDPCSFCNRSCWLIMEPQSFEIAICKAHKYLPDCQQIQICKPSMLHVK